MKPVRIEQPILRKVLEKRGFNAQQLVADAIRRMDCRSDGIVLTKKHWPKRYVDSGNFENDTGITLTEETKPLVIKAMRVVLERVKARNTSRNGGKLYSNMAFRKLKYPKELTIYELSYIAKKMGVAEKKLIDNIFDGFGILGEVSEQMESRETELLKEIGKLKEEVAKRKGSEKELKQTIRELRISRTNLRKEIEMLKKG